MPENCGTCYFWRVDEKLVGECRKHAPTIVDGENFDTRGFWPVTEASEWCGEYTAIQISSWTTTPPVVDGDYWVYEHDDEYFDEPTIVSVTNIKHLSEQPYFTFWFGGVEYELSRVTYWLGPLPIPDPPKR